MPPYIRKKKAGPEKHPVEPAESGPEEMPVIGVVDSQICESLAEKEILECRP